MKQKSLQGTEFVTTHDKLNDEIEEPEKKRCGVGLKRVGATCCKATSVVAIELRQSVCDDLERAVYYIQTLPQRIKEVQEAAEAVLEEGRRQGL